MQKHSIRLAIIALVLLCFALFQFSTPNAAHAATGINHMINFQGKLVNTNGTNVTDGTYSIVFSIYTVSSAGSNIWTETQTPTVTNGIFQVNLGAVTALPGSVDFNTDNIYLGIKVGADAEMTPRVQFTSVPQAFNSEKLGGLDKTGFIQNTTVQQAASNFNISGAGVVGTSLTTPLLQAAAATALTITGNAASIWSTTAGNLTLQAGSGTVSLGSTTTLTSSGALAIAPTSTLSLTSVGTLALAATGANIITASTNGNERLRIDSAGNVGIGTSSPGAKLQVQDGTIGGFSVGTASSVALGYGTSYAGFNATRNAGAGTFSTINDGANNGASVVYGNIAGTFNIAVIPSTGATNQTITDATLNSNIRLSVSSGGISATGSVNASTGYTINSIATTGNYLRGNGTNFVSSAILSGDIPSGSGNYIQNQTASPQTGGLNVSGTGTFGGAVSSTTYGSNFGTTTSCCAITAPTISLSELTSSNGRVAGIQFHNSGSQEAYLQLAKGSRTFVVGDNQGSGASFAEAIQSPTSVTATPSTTGGTLVAGTYYYAVTAIGQDGGETTYAQSNEKTAVTTGTTSSVSLTWGAVANAVSYRIYRGTSSGGENVYYSSATNSYTDTNAASTAANIPLYTQSYANKISVNGSSYLLGGNVGIGTTAPGAKLEISAGNAGGNGIILSNNDAFSFRDSTGTARRTLLVSGSNTTFLGPVDTGWGAATLVDAGTDLSLKVNGSSGSFTTALFVQGSTGNVGIGTTTPATKLEVNGALKFTNASADTNDGRIGSALFAPGLNVVGINTDSTYRKINIWGGITQNENSGGNTFMGNTNFPGSGIWNSSGNVGIGTTAPAYLLDIRNNTASSELHVSGDNADDGGYLLSNNANSAYLSAGESYNGSIWTAKSTSATIIGQSAGAFSFFSNTGLTVGNSVGVNQIAGLSSTGVLSVNTGYQIAGAAAAGNYLRGNGTNFVSSAILSGDLPAGSGSYIQNQTASPQSGSGFNIAGSGLIGGNLTVTGLVSGAKLNNQLQKSGDAATNNYKILSLPLSTNSTLDNTVVDLVIGGWGSANKANLKLLFANRNAFSYTWSGSGDNTALASYGTVTAYNNSGVTDVYIKFNPSSFAAASYTVSNTQPGVTVYATPTDVGATPTGTLIFDASSASYLPSNFTNFSNNMGVNTLAPGQKLDVQGGNINTSGSILTGGTARIDASGNLTNIGTYNGSGNITTTGGVLNIQGAGNNYIAGNVGIGVAPAQNLAVAGNTFGLGVVTPGSTGVIQTYTDGGLGALTTDMVRWGATWTWRHGSAGGQINQLSLDNSNNLNQYNTAGSTVMNVLSPSGNSYITGGNLGVGNITPVAKLTVGGGTANTSGIVVQSSDVSLIFTEDSVTNAGKIQVKAGGSSSAIGASNYSLALQPEGGTVSIGNTGGSYPLDVTGDINSSTALRVGGTSVCTISGCTPASGSGNYIQNQTASPQSGTGFNIAGSGTIGGTLAVTGTIQQNNAAPVYQVQIGGATDHNWKTLANLTAQAGAYVGQSFEVDVIDVRGNFGNTANEQPLKYFVSVIRSAGTQDDTDSATVSGPISDYVRVVKTSNSTYELQGRSIDDWTHIDYTVQGTSGSVSVAYVTTPVNGSTSGTIYLPAVIHTDRFTNVLAAGTLQAASTITGTILNGTTGVNTGGGAGTQRIDSSGNLTNIGTITSGLINGQTISSAANFTGTLNVATSLSTPLISINGGGNPGGQGIRMPYAASTPNGGPSIQWSDASLTNDVGLYINSGLVFQGNAGNPDFRVLTPTTTGALGTEVVHLGGANTSANSWFNGGNVGIGTASPGTKLSVRQTTTYAPPTLGTATGGFSLLSGDGLYGMYAGVDGTGKSWLQNMRNDSATAYDLALQPSGGNVGIGTAAPAGKLQVVGDTYIGSSAGTTSASLYLYGNGTAGVTSTLMTSNGNLHIDAAAGGSGAYLNYYRGTGGVMFGNGAAGSNANVSAAGAYTGTGLNVGAGTITSGLINGQTISSTANFTGTLAVAGAVTSGGAYLADAGTNNLVANGDFEQGTVNWTGISSIVTGGYSGNQAAQFTGSSTLEGVDYIPVNPVTDVIQLEAYVKKTVAGTTPGTMYFGYKAYDASKTAISTAPCGSWCYFASSSTVVPVDGNWHKYSATTTGEGTVYPDFPVGTKYIRVLGLLNYAASGDAVTQVDHVTVRRVNNGPLFVGNNFSTTNLVDQQQLTQLFTTSGNTFTISPPGSGNVNIANSANLQTNGTTRLDGSGNLSNIGTITSGLINGQTISSSANFTGTVAISGSGLYNSAGYQILQTNASDYLRINQNSSYTNGTAAYGAWSFGTGGVSVGDWSASGVAAGSLRATGNIQGSTLTSTVATGTAPLAVNSTTKVTNLNADLLDGLDSTAFAASTGGTGYIQNQTASPQTAGFNINGNGTLGGNLTVTGVAQLNGSVAYNNEYPTYHYLAGGGTNTNWQKAATIAEPTGLYTGVSFQVDVLNANGNFGQTVNVTPLKYFVSANRSGGVQDDVNAGSVSGPINEYVRLIKTATGSYELQVRQPGSYQHVDYTIHELSANNVTVTWVNPVVDGATAGTIYTPTVTHTDTFTNLNAAGSVTSSGTGFYGATGLALQTNDSWLRLNGNSSFTAGLYIPGRGADIVGDLRVGTSIQIGGVGSGGAGTTIVDSSRNLLNIGTITSGLINGQTITSAANFTGTVVAAGSLTGADVISTGNVGFHDNVYALNVPNPIWSFGNATAYGMAYYQGSALAIGDAIGFHFGNVAAPVATIAASGAVAGASFNATTGFQIAGTAASGNYLRGNGTNFVSSAIQAADLPAGSGSYIQNTTIQQASSNFNISGSGVVGTTLAVAGNVNIGGGLSGRRLDVYDSANNGDGLAIGQDADNSQTIQAYIDNQWTNRVTYASGCCNLLKLQPDVGSVQIGSASNPTSGLTVTGITNSTSFTGAGTGLTGTASSLSIGGNAATVTDGMYLSPQQYVTGVKYFQSNKGATSYLGANNTYTLEAFANDGGAAAMSFHRGGQYAVNFGLDPDNILRIGGWCAPANVLQLDMSGNETVAGNLTANGTGFYGTTGLALQANDTWLRLNGNSSFTSGLYIPGRGVDIVGDLRVGTSIQIGGVGSGGAGTTIVDSSRNLLNIGNVSFSGANPSMTASSYITMSGGAYFSSGTVYAEAAIQARGGIHDDAHALLAVSGGTSGNTNVVGFLGVGNVSPTTTLSVNGATTLQGFDTSYNAAVLNGNLFTANIFNAATGWTAISGSGATAVATHTAGGGTTSITTDFTPTAGATYQVVFTIAGNTTDTDYIYPSLGSFAGPNLGSNTTYTIVFTASSTTALAFNPSTNFNGTLSNVTVKLVTLATPTLTVKTSAGTSTLEVRTSTSNTYIGLGSGKSNTTGTNNTALGNGALFSNMTGYSNTANGSSALFSNTTGHENTATGDSALSYNVSGNGNSAYGAYALSNNINGWTNVAIGGYALYGNISGDDNTATGYMALQANTTGTQNTANGGSSLLYNTTGSYNTAIGFTALQTNTTGSYNAASGIGALYKNTTGYQNTASGAYALWSNNTGANNTALGYQALNDNTSGGSNTATGEGLYNNTTGSNNTASGYGALDQNTTGGNNTAIGYFALGANTTTGANNTSIGYSAGRANTTGTNNTFLGYNAGYTGTTATLTNATAIGYNAQVTASSSIVLGGTGADAVKVGIGLTNPGFALDVAATTAVVANFNRSNDGTVINFASGGTVQGTISIAGATTSYNAFTGSHYAHITAGTLERGMLAALTGTSDYAAGAAEPIYGIVKSQTANQANILGAYLAKLNPSDPYSVTNPELVMAAGNGDIWIADNGTGNVKIGDPLISSTIAGYAMRDPKTFAISHVFAKVAEPIDWSTVTATVNGVKVAKVTGLFSFYNSDNLSDHMQAQTISAGTLQTTGDLSVGGNDSVAGNLNVGGIAHIGTLQVAGSADITANLHIGGDLAVTGSATIGGKLDIAGDLTVAGATSVMDITIAGHIITAGDTPQVAALVAAGTNATVTVTGNDTSGTITITTGDAAVAATSTKPAIPGPTVGELTKLMFNLVFKKAPQLSITPANAEAANLRIFRTSDLDHFSINTTDIPKPNTTYSYDYFVRQ